MKFGSYISQGCEHIVKKNKHKLEIHLLTGNFLSQHVCCIIVVS